MLSVVANPYAHIFICQPSYMLKVNTISKRLVQDYRALSECKLVFLSLFKTDASFCLSLSPPTAPSSLLCLRRGEVTWLPIDSIPSRYRCHILSKVGEEWRRKPPRLCDTADSGAAVRDKEKKKKKNITSPGRKASQRCVDTVGEPSSLLPNGPRRGGNGITLVPAIEGPRPELSTLTCCKNLKKCC